MTGAPRGAPAYLVRRLRRLVAYEPARGKMEAKVDTDGKQAAGTPLKGSDLRVAQLPVPTVTWTIPAAEVRGARAQDQADHQVPGHAQCCAPRWSAGPYDVQK